MADADDPRLSNPEFVAAAHADGFSPGVMAEIIDRLADDDHRWKRQPGDGATLRDAAADARDDAGEA